MRVHGGLAPRANGKDTTVAEQTDKLRTTLDTIQQRALIVGGAALALTVVGFAVSTTSQVLQSYLFAFLFFFGISAGSMFLLSLQNVTSGVWGLIIRRFVEAGALNIPWMAIMFIPIAAGVGVLYLWADPAVVAEDYVIAKKAPYLNVTFFLIRSAFYFLAWGLLVYKMRKLSLAQDAAPKSESENYRDQLARWGGPSVVAHVMLWTFAATDWGMSLEPLWASSMYPVGWMAGQILTTFAVMIIVLWMFTRENLLGYEVPVDRLHDLGKFTFAFTVLWTYLNFSQYLIIWSGNVAEFTPWYHYRTNGGWEYLAIALIFGHFFLPFFLLLSRHTKRNFNVVSRVSMWIVAIELIYVFWLVNPAFHHDGFQIHWTHITALAGVGGIWLWMAIRHLKEAPILPPNDHRIPELEAQLAPHDHGHAAHSAGH